MFIRLNRLLHTFTFRFALVYVVLFSLSVIILFFFIHTFAQRYLEEQTTDAISIRFEMLRAEYQENGSVGLEKTIEELIASDEDSIEIYMLINAEDERKAGNLNEWPKSAPKEGSYDSKGSWIRFAIQGTRNYPGSTAVKAITYPLSNWRRLLVGQSMQNVKKVEQTIAQAFWASLALTFFMALVGALVMTRSVMKRLAVINRSVNSIMHGSLSARIPHNKGGDEFDELSFNLNEMLEKIEQLLFSLSQFANNIAHDLRSPLNRIVARTDAGLRGLKGESVARRLLEKNVEDMEGLIATFNSILRISELEANTDALAFDTCNLVKIIEDVVEFYEPLASEKTIQILNETSGKILVHCEKNLLTQAFANVLDNAIKFTAKEGTVTIHAYQTNNVVEVSFADNGPGIPDAYQDKVFEKFFRMEENRSTPGNGLGLSLVAAVIRIHKSKVVLKNNQPGLKLTFTFPRIAELTPES